MSRRWQRPKRQSPQRDLFLQEGRGRFTPPVKAATDTSAGAAAAMGIGPRGKDVLAQVGDLARAMLEVVDRRAARARLRGVMLAITVRKQVYEYIHAHPEGATADEIAAALGYSILTVRPRVSELNSQGAIADSGIRRANASGRPAIVWRASADARAMERSE